MPIDLSVSITATSAGQTIQSNTSPQAGAIEWLVFDLAPASTDTPVLVQPGPANQMLVLALQADPGDDSISYKPAIGGPALTLNGAHLYNGPHMVALLGANPTTLYFSNSSANPVSIKILVGRNP